MTSFKIKQSNSDIVYTFDCDQVRKQFARGFLRNISSYEPLPTCIGFTNDTFVFITEDDRYVDYLFYLYKRSQGVSWIQFVDKKDCLLLYMRYEDTQHTEMLEPLRSIAPVEGCVLF